MSYKNLVIPKWPMASEKEKELINEVLESENWWRNAGIQVKLFEKEFAEYQGARNSISVSNGTQAIEIALKALGIGAGDEVIVPDFTFYSTVSAVLAVKAIPVLVDVREDTFCIDPEQIEKAISPRTKAIIPVHMAGNIADMDYINKIAKDYHLYVIEDAAHAHGAFWKNKGAGTIGTIGTFSFQNAKLMTAGEGGIILSNDDSLSHVAFLQTNCGREENDTSYQHVLIGTNARLSEVQGAILRAQLSRLEQQVKKREENYEYLCEYLNSVDGIRMQTMNEDMTSNPHYMVMFYYDKTFFGNANRDEFVQYLRDSGVPCNRSYESIHRLPVIKTLDKEQWRMLANGQCKGEKCCVHSEKISKEVICLSHNILLGDKNLMYNIAKIICNFKEKTRLIIE